MPVYSGRPRRATLHGRLPVAGESGLLRNAPDYLRPGPFANVSSGHVIRAMTGNFFFDGFTGTVPGTPKAVSKAENALL